MKSERKVPRPWPTSQRDPKTKTRTELFNFLLDCLITSREKTKAGTKRLAFSSNCIRYTNKRKNESKNVTLAR